MVNDNHSSVCSKVVATDVMVCMVEVVEVAVVVIVRLMGIVLALVIVI